MFKNSVDRYNVPTVTVHFDNYLSQKNLSKVTRKNYVSDLRMFLSWMNAHENVPDFNVRSITLYKEFLQSSRLPVRSINRSLSSLRAFGDLLTSVGDQFSNPARLVSNIAITSPIPEMKFVQEFSRSNGLPREDVLALNEFMNLSHERT